MPCCQTPPRTRSTTERDDLDRTDAIQPYLIFIYAWSGRRPMNNSANESMQTEISYRSAELSRDFAHILGLEGTGEAAEPAVGL